MDGHQMEPFDQASDAPKGAAVVPFPLDRDVGRVRHVAKLYLSKTSEKAQRAYWGRSVCDRLRETMRKIGIPDDEIARQIEAFRLAVSYEMTRIADGQRRKG